MSNCCCLGCCNVEPMGANYNEKQICELAWGKIGLVPSRFYNSPSDPWAPNAEHGGSLADTINILHHQKDLLFERVDWYFRRCYIYLSTDQIGQLEQEKKIHHLRYNNRKLVTTAGHIIETVGYYQGRIIISTMQEEVRLFPHFFVEVLALIIAKDLAIRASNDRALSKTMYQLAELQFKESVRIDSKYRKYPWNKMQADKPSHCSHNIDSCSCH